MTYLDQSKIHLLDNRSLFEDIHRLKSFFTQLFSDLANEIPTSDLLAAHPSSQGVKISKGNELAHCPYQVLDIVRDFNKDKGLNIRVLNWWGRGLYVLVYLGKYNPKLFGNPHFLSQMQSLDYLMSEALSPWDYQGMIDEGRVSPIPPFELISHLSELPCLQLIKKIPYPEDLATLRVTLNEQIRLILKYYVG